MGKLILVKPHHVLDIIKLYGAGYKKFVPDPAYGHDFFRVGNTILQKPNQKIKLTIKADDMCKPCKFNKNGSCADVVTNSKGFTSKQEWNKTIDTRLFSLFSFKEGDKMTVKEFYIRAKEKLTKKAIEKIWKERPKSETIRRVALLQKGLEDYCAPSKGV